MRHSALWHFVRFYAMVKRSFMKGKIIFTIILVVIGAASVFLGVVIFGHSDSPQKQEAAEETEGAKKESIFAFLNMDMEREKGIQKALTEKSKQILGVWAALKVINGVINVLQSAEVGVAVASVNPLEFLAPVDNILDKVSNMLLWALGAIVFEKIILALSGYLVFTFLIPACALVSIITVWTYKDRARMHKIVVIALMICLIVPFAVPLSFKVSTFVEKKFLTNKVNNLVSSLNEKEESADGMIGVVTARSSGRSAVNYMTNAKNLGEAMIEDMINYFIIFVITGIFIPILTIFGIYKITKYSAKMILEK